MSNIKFLSITENTILSPNLTMDSLIKSSISFYETSDRSKIFSIKLLASDFLTKIEIPSIQREVDTEWVESLRNSFVKSFETHKFFDFGRFEVIEYQNLLYLIDGQHRYNVLESLVSDYTDIQVEIRIRCVDTEVEMNKIFVQVNSCRQTPICKSVDSKVLINTVRRYLTDEYPEYIKSTTLPRKPHISLDLIESQFERLSFASKILDAKLNPNDVVSKLKELNDFYHYTRQKTWSSWSVPDYANLVDTCKRKSPSKPLFLGIYRSLEWIDRLLYVLTNPNIHFSDLEHRDYVRVRVPSKLRKLVWGKRNGSGNTNGVCYCCKAYLEYENMEAGHKRSVVFGGVTKLSNLEPICGSCNKDMRTMDLEEYRSKYFE